MALMLPAAAGAQTLSTVRHEQWKEKGKAERVLLGLVERMEILEAEGWSDSLQHEYLATALSVAYFGTLLYAHDHSRLPETHADLIEEGYVAVWPGNPFNNWRPLRLFTPEEGFYAGELCLQVCPSDLVGELPMRFGPNCFELGIFAPTADQSVLTYDPPEPMPQNISWAIVPEGLIYMAGSYYTIPDSGKVNDESPASAETTSQNPTPTEVD